MKTFAMPIVELVRFNVADVITTSGGSECTNHDPSCPSNMCPGD